MRTASTPSRATPNHPAEATDAITLLTEDHESIKAMFSQYAALGERAIITKKRLATQICAELTKHVTAEEEIFYPALLAAGKDQQELVDEAIVEHASAMTLIEQILDMAPTEHLFDAKIKVLSELIEHHVKEEESEMFPQARKAGLDLMLLGQQIAERKAEITV
jgi:hemerythrin superfamily protein